MRKREEKRKKHFITGSSVELMAVICGEIRDTIWVR